VCVTDTSPLEVLVDRASKRLYEMLVIGEHVTLKVTSHGSMYDILACCVIPVFSVFKNYWLCCSIYLLSFLLLMGGQNVSEMT